MRSGVTGGSGGLSTHPEKQVLENTDVDGLAAAWSCLPGGVLGLNPGRSKENRHEGRGGIDHQVDIPDCRLRLGSIKRSSVFSPRPR